MEKGFITDNSSMLHIGFVARLEKEKGANIIMELIKTISGDDELKKRVSFHIIWDGSLRSEFIKLQNQITQVHLYGTIPQGVVLEKMKQFDLLCMPSVFLETFWLVALEALTRGVPVCGPRAGWLREFISTELSVDMDHPISDIVKIIKVLSTGVKYILPDIRSYSLEWWTMKMEEILWVRKNILIIHDYMKPLWWAEAYVDFLGKQILWTGRTLYRYWYTGTPSKISRIWQMFLSQIAFWRYYEIQEYIQNIAPDVIWWHNILRFIWPWWMKAVYDSHVPYIISHHDLGLIVARPSVLENERDIPHALSHSEFINGSRNPVESLMRSIKYISLNHIWKYLGRAESHIVPSSFMQQPLQDITGKKVIVFPHTIIK